MVVKKRKNIQVRTFNKIKDFLEKQKKPIYKADVVKKLNVDLDSLKLALEMLKIKYDDEGRISVIKRKKK